MLLHDLRRQVTVQADNLAVQLPIYVYLFPCVRKLRSRLTLASKVKNLASSYDRGKKLPISFGLFVMDC